MKATLEFNLPEDQNEFEIASKASDTLAAVNEFCDYIRNRLKHSDISEQAGDELEYLRDKLVECFDDYNVKHLLDY